MKKVFSSNRELAHIWASQSQPEGRAHNFYFEGVSIFSYGPHFEIARFVDSKTVLFTTRTYGQATSKHIGFTHQAIGGDIAVYQVPSFSDHDQNVKRYLEKIVELQAQAVRSRSHSEYIKNELVRVINEARRYVKRFGDVKAELVTSVYQWNDKLKSNSLFSNAELAKIKKAAQNAREAQKVAREKKEIERKELEKEALEEMEKWKRGELDRLPFNYSFYNMPTTLRIKEGRIETSKGAQITVKTAVGLWKNIKTGQNVVGTVLDNYMVNKWDGEVLTVGCHAISYSELNRLAVILGVAV